MVRIMVLFKQNGFLHGSETVCKEALDIKAQE